MRSLRSVFPVLLLAACGGREDGPAKGIDPPKGGAVSLEPLFEQQAFGEITRMAVGRLGPEGERAVVTVGRQVHVQREGDLSPIWSQEWKNPGESVSFAFATELTVVDVNGDGIDDVLVATNAPEALAWDGRDGALLWRLPLGEREGSIHLVPFGDPDRPVFLSSMGHGWEVETGEPSWRLDLRGEVWFVHEALRGPGEATLLYLGIGETPPGQPDAFAIDGAGNVVFSLDSGTFLTAVGGADLDGGGSQSMVLGMPNGAVRAVGPDGETRWEVSFDIGGNGWFTHAETILPIDVDGDGKDELALSVTNHNEPDLTVLVLLSPEGEELARTPIGTTAPALHPIAGAEGKKLLARIGAQSFDSRGEAALFDPAAMTQLWRTTFPWFVTDLRPVDGSPSGVLAASVDGRLRRLDLGSGQLLGEKYVGYFPTGAVHLVDDLLIGGDVLGTLSARRLDGTLAWHWSFPFVGPGTLVDWTTVEVEGATRIVALGSDDFSPTHTAWLQILDPQGRELLAIDSPLLPRKVASGRGAGGEARLALGLADPVSMDCEVHLLGAERGERQGILKLPRCRGLSMVMEDVDGDGRDEIFVSGWSPSTMPFVALFDDDGTPLFENTLTTLPNWVAARGDALFVGGAGGDGAGFVARLHTNGSHVWEAALPFLHDEADPRKRLPGDSWYGAVIPGKKGLEGVAATTSAGQLHLLDDETGAVRWTVDLHGDEPRSGAIQGGPVAFVPPSDDTAGFLVTGPERHDLSTGRLFAVTLQGEVVSTPALSSGCIGLDVSIGSDRIGVATQTGIAAIAVEPLP